MSEELGKRSINDWLVEYTKIVKSYNITGKTFSNRNSSIRWISEKLGSKCIGSIKPYEIAIELKLEYSVHQAKAKRLLIEIKNMFTEAIIYGWINTNPAIYLKAQPVNIQRQRMTLEEWQLMYEYSKRYCAKWVPILLLLALLTGQRRADLGTFKFTDIKDGNLYLQQQKTGTKLAIPLRIKLDVIDTSLQDIVEQAKSYYVYGETIIRKHNGSSLSLASLSSVFHNIVVELDLGKNITLHECRSLSERLYREQGINTRLLLGHKHQSMTDMYNDDRGLNKNSYTIIPIN